MNSVVWNPAGLVNISNREVMFMYGKPYAGLSDELDLSYNYLAYAQKLLNIGYIGAAWSQYSDADVYKQNIVGLGFARTLKKIHLGLTVKYLSHYFNWDYLYDPNDTIKEKGDTKAKISVDAGLLFQPKEKICLGVVFKNLNEPDLGFVKSDPTYREIRAGVKLNLKKATAIITPAIEISSRKNETNFSAGIETWLKNKTIGLRTGMNDTEIAFGGSYYR
ncbi:MAG: conjugal transfer protein TraF, partial [Elusimicrobiota bacterium]|nr:conjugal transfer protein TraF [Elusimicrobiota bacterium]